MLGKNALLLLMLTLTLLSGVLTATVAEELDVTVIDGTAIPFASKDHLAYGIVKIWNKMDAPITTTLSIAPNRDHHLDDNRYWGNYKEIENIKIDANELRIQIFCFTIPAGSELGQQTWTLNVTAKGETITKKVAVNLPVIKDVEIVTPSWKPDILKLEFPPGKPGTFTVEASEPAVIVSLLDIAGDLNSKKVCDVELETVLPDTFFSYPEEITVEMSKPKRWDFDNQTFLPFTVISIPLLTANIPYSTNGNIYDLELQLEEERTGLKTSLPFQLVVTAPTETASKKKTVEAETEVVKENMTAVSVNETVNNSENITVTETVVTVNPSETVALTTSTPIEETETDKSSGIWQNFIGWLWHSIAGTATFIICCCILL